MVLAISSEQSRSYYISTLMSKEVEMTKLWSDGKKMAMDYMRQDNKPILTLGWAHGSLDSSRFRKRR